MAMQDPAQKYRFVPRDPDTWGSVDTWTFERAFRCQVRSISASENVRSGRDAGNTGKRFWYFPRFVSFSLGDRIKYDGKDYQIISIPDTSNPAPAAYVDTRAIQ